MSVKTKAKIKLLFEDEDLLVVNKPSGVLSIPDRYDTTKLNLKNWLEKQFSSVFTVHRLDRETSGVVVFARNREAHKRLSRQFERREVEKIYWVLVDGHPQPEKGRIEVGIAPHPTRAGKMIVSNKGKKSATNYQIIEQFRQFSLVEAVLETGRTHQVRVHFESIGYPLAVDEMYGLRSELFLSSIKQRKYTLGKNQVERPLMKRTTLHATRLSFNHPTTQKRVIFEASLPKDFAALLKQLQKWGK